MTLEGRNSVKSAFLRGSLGRGGGLNFIPLTLDFPFRLDVIKSLLTTGLPMGSLGPPTASGLLALVDATLELGSSKWQLW